MDRFPHLRHTGTVPTSEERMAVLLAQKSSEERRDTLQEKLDELRRSMKEVEEELELVEKHNITYASILSPIRCLPADVLRRIFALAIPRNVARMADMTVASPWTILRVCRHWRDICLMYGTLWSRVYLENGVSTPELPTMPVTLAGEIANMMQLYPGGPYRMTERAPTTSIARAADLLELQLQRSGNATLSITIQTCPETDYVQPFLRILLPHIHRASYIKAPFHILRLFQLQPGQFERLTHVMVDYLQVIPIPGASEALAGETGVTGPTALDTLLSQPRLIQRGAVCIPRWFTNHATASPLQLYRPELLTTLVILDTVGRDARDPYFYTMFSQLQNLTELHLLVPSHHRLSPHRQRPELFAHEATVQLSKLQTLTVCDNAKLNPLLTLIIAPGLEDLTYKGTLDHNSLHLDAFLENSQPRLRTLQIQSSDTREHELSAFFSRHAHRWESLHTLGFSHCTEVDDLASGMGQPISWPETIENDKRFAHHVLRLLTRQTPAEDSLENTPPDLFPQLLHLDLEEIIPSVNHLIDMLESRQLSPTGVRLRNCYLSQLRCSDNKFTDTEMQTIGFTDATLRNLNFEVQAHGPSDVEYWDMTDRLVLGYETRNQQVPWKKGLGRYPEEKKRLDALQEGGLEIWLKPGVAETWVKTLVLKGQLVAPQGWGTG